MRRITLGLLSTVAALVLLFSYRTSTSGADPATDTAAVAPDSGTSPRSPGSGSSSGSPGSGSSSGSVDGASTVDGSVAQTRWGPVQVRITVADGKITDVQVIQVPEANFHEQQLNAYATSILRDDAIEAQSADIDTVSGATYTSDGYRESLQAAIDAANLG